MRRRFLVNLLLAALLLLACGACGYHREGQYPAGAERPRLYIELFANDTHRAFANDVLTVQVIERFARSPLFVIVEDPSLADLLLGGRITSYETEPIAYSQSDTIAAYKADLSVRATLRRPGAEREVAWSGTLTTRRDYTGNNPELVMGQSAERLADNLYIQVTDALFWREAK